MGNNFLLVVREDELEKYKEHNPEIETIGTPPHINNIAKTRQWILEKYVDENIFMVDDDVTAVVRTYVEKGEESKIDDPVTILEIIRENAYIAKQIGAFTWGYQSIRNPNEYNSHKPLKHTGYLNNSHIGFLKGHGLVYDLGYGEAEDYYISCLNYYKHRFSLIDRRFTFMTKDNFLASGGVNDIRTIDMMVENTIKLREVFGECIVVKKPTANKKKVHMGERSIVFPY